MASYNPPTRVPWAEPVMNGELFETMVGCLLLSEYPEATRIRPSQGDGGVDIYNHVDDDQIEIFQCKYFSGSIRWTQVEKSLEHLSSGNAHERQIVRWHLVVPKQPTDRQKKTLDAKTKDMPFKCYWLAEDKLNQLISTRPEIVDYYLGNGKERLSQKLEDWRNITDLAKITEGRTPTFESVVPKLNKVVEALDRDDPHFKYGIEASPKEPDNKPKAVATLTVKTGSNYVSLSVFPKYNGAIEDAGQRLSGSFSFRGNGIEKYQKAKEYNDESVVLSAEDLADIEFPTFGYSGIPDLSGATLKIGPAKPAKQNLQVRIESPEYGPWRRVLQGTATAGTEGVSIKAISPGGNFEITSRIPKPTADEIVSSSIEISNRKSLVGLDIADLVEDLKWLRRLHPGAELAMTLSPGPTPRLLTEIPQPFFDPYLLGLLESLTVIQDFTHDHVRVPDLDLPEEAFYYVVITAAILVGIPVTETVNTMSFEVDLPSFKAGEGPFNFNAFVSAPLLVVPGQEIKFIEPVYAVQNTGDMYATSIKETESGNHRVQLEPQEHGFVTTHRITQPGTLTPNETQTIEETEYKSFEQLITGIRHHLNNSGS